MSGVCIISWVQFHPGRILDFTFDRTLGFPGRSVGKESASSAEDQVQLLGQEVPLEEG